MRGCLALVLLAVIASGAGAKAAMSDTSRKAFTQSCQHQMYMTSGECACMAEIADRTLDEAAVAYLSLDALDVRSSAAMAKSMSAAEIRSIDHFMQTAPRQCKGAT